MIQTLFTRFQKDGCVVDNSVESEVVAWLKLLETIRPERVIVYSTARDTALPGVERVESSTLEKIAERVRSLGIPAEVY